MMNRLGYAAACVIFLLSLCYIRAGVTSAQPQPQPPAKPQYSYEEVNIYDGPQALADVGRSGGEVVAVYERKTSVGLFALVKFTR